jgi:hypothetical protein
MLATASINAANLIQDRRSHFDLISLLLPKFYRGKVTGNELTQKICPSVLPFREQSLYDESH